MRFSICLFAALAASSSLLAGAIGLSNLTSSATLINFDTMAGGNCNLCGPSVTNQYASSGVVFNNPSHPGQVTADTNLTLGIPGSSFPNALFVNQGGQLNQPAAIPFEILFSIPITAVGFDYGSSLDSFLRLDAYSSDNTLLESLIYVGSLSPVGLSGFAGIQESTPIGRLDVSYHPFSDPSRTLSFSIDNLSFEASPVPEPSAAMLVGLGLLGIALGCVPTRFLTSRS